MFTHQSTLFYRFSTDWNINGYMYWKRRRINTTSRHATGIDSSIAVDWLLTQHLVWRHRLSLIIPLRVSQRFQEKCFRFPSTESNLSSVPTTTTSGFRVCAGFRYTYCGLLFNQAHRKCYLIGTNHIVSCMLVFLQERPVQRSRLEIIQ